ncbi:hypothetical protein AVEN_25745-1 [Araneus ventricosus]|uniref:Uncharacterized protein n=1 Tax=Araneus ventricosus TaxID=182803 RepID=A0A4Y2NLZ0_ARAVE|nr:hypothetical protein AVEN_25745-1 [Araneus ventricosus]
MVQDEACDPHRCTNDDKNAWFHRILDVNETRCGPDDQDSSGLANRAIWTLTDIDLCPTDVETYVSIVLGVLSKQPIPRFALKLSLKILLNLNVL